MSITARLAGIAALGALPLLLSPLSSEAATVNVSADFRDSAGASMWTVDFSYDNALNPTRIGYADLSALQVNTGRSIYDLAYIAGTTMSPYLAFAYDTVGQRFRPTVVAGYSPFASAIASDYLSGFFIGPYAIAGSEFALRDYSGSAPEEFAHSVVITQRIAAVPLPAAGLLLLAGLGGLGLMRRKRTSPAAA